MPSSSSSRIPPEAGSSLGASHVLSDKVVSNDGSQSAVASLPASSIGASTGQDGVPVSDLGDSTVAGPTSNLLHEPVSAASESISFNPEAEDQSVLPTDKTVISRRGAFDEFGSGNPITPQSLGQLLIGKRLEHYELVEFVGGGGMGAVFRAIDTRLGRTVAVKVLSRDQNDEETIRRFRNEAQSAARLDHPHIARVHYVGEDAGWNYIVFEFIEGINLRDYIYAHGVLSVSDALGYTLQVAEALQHAASRDVVHRDIKPSNILLMNDGQVKLVDMGLARLHQVETSSEDLTASGVTLGTFDYISPEQARDPRIADVRSDIYSLGCTLYFWLAGQPPFPDGTALQKLLKHNSDQPPDLRQFREDLPAGVMQLVTKMLSKKPSQRYQTPAELITEIHRLGQQLGITPQITAHSGVSVTLPPAPWWERALPWVLPFAALAVLLVFIEVLINRQQTPMVVALRPQVQGPGIRTQPENLQNGAKENSANATTSTQGTGATAVDNGSTQKSTDIAKSGSSGSSNTKLPMSKGSEAPPIMPMVDSGISGSAGKATTRPAGNNTANAGASTSVSEGASAPNETLVNEEGKTSPITGGDPTRNDPITASSGAASGGTSAANTLPDAIASSGASTPPIGTLASLGAPPLSSVLSADRIAVARLDLSDSVIPVSADVVPMTSVKVARIVVLPSDQPPRSDWGPEVEVVRSLGRACMRAQELGLSEVELNFTGEMRERPFTLNSPKNLVIRAAVGAQPTIVFQPEQDASAQTQMIRMLGSSSGRVTITGLHLVLDLPDQSSGEWSLLWLQQLQSLQIDNCVLTIREGNLSLGSVGPKAAFISMAPRSFPETMTTMMEDGMMMSSPTSVVLNGTIIRGEGVFLRLTEEMPAKITWRHGLFVSPQRLIDNEGAVKKPSDFDAIELDLDHVTAIMPQGLYRVKLRPGAPYQVKLDIQSNHSILYTGLDSYLFDFVDLPLKDDVKLSMRGEENCYPRTNPRYLRLTTTKGESQVFDFENRKKWSVENRPRVGIAWKKPRTDDFFSESRPHQLGKPDFVLDPDAPNQAGFDPLKLPEIAPLVPRGSLEPMTIGASTP